MSTESVRAPSIPESPLTWVTSDLACTPSPSVHTQGCHHGSPPPPKPFSTPPPFRSRAPAPAWVARCTAATSVTVFPPTACCGGWTAAQPCPFPLHAAPLHTVLACKWGGAHGTVQGTGGGIPSLSPRWHEMRGEGAAGGVNQREWGDQGSPPHAKGRGMRAGCREPSREDSHPPPPSE